MTNTQSLDSLTPDQLSSTVGGQAAPDVGNMTLNQVVDVAKMGGCLDSTFQRGMEYGRAGWKADNRLLQPDAIPGYLSRGQRLEEAATACKNGGGY